MKLRDDQLHSSTTSTITPTFFAATLFHKHHSALSNINKSAINKHSMTKSESNEQVPTYLSSASHEQPKEKQPSRKARQEAYASRQASSSRSLVSLDSVQSFLELDSDLECSEHSEHSTVTVDAGFSSVSVDIAGPANHITEQHFSLIQTSWKAFLGTMRNHSAAGKKILCQVLQLKPSARPALGIDQSQPSTPRWTDLSKTVVSLLDRIILGLEKSQDAAFDQDLIMMGEEWLEEGLDTRLVHKALIQCLEDSLDADDYSYETAEAWASTFKDALQKITLMY